ncbi:MAG: tRNA (guanosine(46)-N7)-methyltransferase TrmB [Firmicutes bacterium]|nr:tRNA (guanosine(46)-N7)-methyltransferase TrmB [Bacillota bacterium]
MRHRKVKNLEPRIEACRHYLVPDAKINKGKWRLYFGAASDSRLYLELGCGKGKFLCAHATADPDARFIGIEGLDAVMVRGLERASEENIANIRFVMDFVSDIRDYFADGELDGIYLNFSDPWPKPRHEKRRFTYGPTLLKYQQILKPEGFVAFKTDNEELFDYSIGEIERLELCIEELSRDLHHSDYEAKNFTTEYEEKFHGRGKNINYVKFTYPQR